MIENLKILLVEDVTSDAELIFREISKNGIVFEKLLVDNKKDFLAGLKNFKPDQIISDYSLPRFNGMQALLIRNKMSPLTPFILVTGSNNETIAVDCMKAGADDYILKDNLSRLGLSVNNAVNRGKALREKNIAEEALHESEERYRLIVEKSPNTIAIHQDGKLVFINPAGAKLVGAKASEEIVGRSILDVVHPDGRRNVIQRMQQVDEGMEAPIFEEKFIKLDGTIIDVEVVGIPIYFQGRAATQVIVRDITEQKKAERALKESEEKSRSIMENSADAIFITDKQGKYIYTNKEVTRMLGFTSEEMKSKTIIDLTPKNETEKYLKLFMEVLNEGKVFTEIELLKKDGSFISTDLNSVLLPGGQIYGSCRDITERKNAEESLRNSLAFSDSLLKTIPFGMDIVDESGKVLFLSDSFTRLFGEEAIGKKCWNLYRDDKKQCNDCPLRKGITIGETEAYESHGVLGNRIFDINHTGMIYQGKKAMLEIFQDITERKKNEEELIEAKEKAEESDRLKTAFLHNISHEIRTPMNAIIGFSALLGDPELDAPTRINYVDMIDQGSNQLLAIIKDILDISNIEANLVKIVKNEVNINATFNSICEQFRIKADDKELSLTCEYGLEDNEAFILTDSTKLIQILTNLVSNALKFTSAGEIKLEYKVLDNFLKFSVQDSGIGIPNEYQDKIFERFFQVENSLSRIYEGTGLGLAISKSYVELLGGKIWITSKPEKGTSVFFTIPFEKSRPEEKSEMTIQVSDSLVFSEKKTILVVEDIESNFVLIKYFLSRANTNIIRAINGKDAVEKALSGDDIDLILMDIKMPVMDGFTATKIIRERNKTIPIIAQTAYIDDKEMAFECGCSGFISKPFDKKGLFKAMREFF